MLSLGRGGHSRGLCDDQQLLCLSLAVWNGKDPLLKEVLFGLSNKEGNHGEDVKELYYYLDGTPTHSYMKMLYKYPQASFPYARILQENAARTRRDPEFEILDTGVFDQDAYFDIFVEYAKSGPEDLLMRIRVENRGSAEAALHVLPTAWFRNTWSLGYNPYKPVFEPSGTERVSVAHTGLEGYYLYAENPSEWLFCDNETNNRPACLGMTTTTPFPQRRHPRPYRSGGLPTVNPDHQGYENVPRRTAPSRSDRGIPPPYGCG